MKEYSGDSLLWGNNYRNIVVIFDFERTDWMLFQKRDVSAKLDIYVFIAITGKIPLLVDYWLLMVSFTQ